MKEKKTVKNSFGVSIVVCCASCKFKDYRTEKDRICRPVKKPTHPSEFCNFWLMAEHLENAGKGDGLVKRKAWLDYVKENGRSDQARRDFERKNGSIYFGDKK